jgi:outer membrane protein OmpA-like peptidoglycan-associated protein
MRSARGIAAILLVGGPLVSIAVAQDEADAGNPMPAGADAAAQAALPNAEVRVITGDIRRIEGLRAVISGAVLSLENVARGLQAGGLQTRAVNGGLEVMLPGDVLFDFDKASIRESAIPVLEKLAQAAEQTGGKPILVEGHTDNVGQPDYNQRLSAARAEAVNGWLVRRGVGKARLTAQGFGATRPVAPNRTADGKDDPAGRQKNRRVTVTFKG